MKLKLRFALAVFFLLVFSIFLMVISSSFFNVLYDDSFFTRSFEKNNVYEIMDVPDLKALEVIAFLNGENLNLSHSNPPFHDIQFTQEEVDHFKDVRDLILTFRNIYFISFGIFVTLLSAFVFNLVLKYKGTAHFKRKLSQFFIKLQISVLLVSAVFLFVSWLFAFFGFRWLFDRFHHVFFEAGTWTFSQDSLSILMFPENFFYDFFIAFLFNIFVFLAMIAILLFFVIYLSKVSSRHGSVDKSDIPKKN